MKEVLRIAVEQTAPGINAVLEGQGIPQWKQPDERITRLAEEAVSIYRKLAAPVGMMMEISRDEFKTVFNGEGLNDDASPVAPIFQASDSLALFAVTIGEPVCKEISRLFRASDFALGSMLDSAASEGTEMTAQLLENLYHQQLQKEHRFEPGVGILRFSPGYCGWDISGQKRLFKHVRPGDIGITLNDSFLMQPLKSISGVIISGPKDIFYFEDVFSFCRDCRTHTCRERIKALMEQ